MLGAFIIPCLHCCHPRKGDRGLHRQQSLGWNYLHQFLWLAHQANLLINWLSCAGGVGERSMAEEPFTGNWNSVHATVMW